MNYRVIITDGAFADLVKFLDYLEFNQGKPLTAERWLRKALAAVETLRIVPHRCPMPPENELRE